MVVSLGASGLGLRGGDYGVVVSLRARQMNIEWVLECLPGIQVTKVMTRWRNG